MTFEQLGIAPAMCRILENLGYNTPTPIQQQAIPILAQGRDVLACAQTGTGKTAAFSLPILQKLEAQPRPRNQSPRVLILTPTRELALQIADNMTAYSQDMPIRNVVIFGGVSQVKQVQQLQRKPEILIATPGRLLDLIGQKIITLQHIDTLVLDEADRMLDMGFIHDIKRIVPLCPTDRQTVLFSATMPNDIRQLANNLMQNPAKVQVDPVSSTAETVQQAIFHVEKGQKPALLEHLMDQEQMARVLVFTRTKHGANKLVQHLDKRGISSAAIHGNKSQNAREKALADFKNSTIKVLVATDIAARGIDIDELPHVLNYDLPEVPETYVHRIGRTGRAGNSGRAFTFITAEEMGDWRRVERLIGRSIPATQHPFTDATPIAHPNPAPQHGRLVFEKRTEQKKSPQEKNKRAKKGRPQNQQQQRQRS